MSAKKIKPTGNKVLVRPLPPKLITDGGIEIPVAWQQPSGQGTVMASGPGRFDRKGNFIPNELKPGDRVLYSWISGVQVNDTGERILTQEEILGVIRLG